METLLSCFPQLFLKCGSKSSTGAKVRKGTKVVCGAKVPGVRKFHGAKVLGTFAPEERKFQGCESSMDRKFLDFSLPRSGSTDRKFHGSESSVYGLFAPRNESAEERKGQIPCVVVRLQKLPPAFDALVMGPRQNSVTKFDS